MSYPPQRSDVCATALSAVCLPELLILVAEMGLFHKRRAAMRPRSPEESSDDTPSPLITRR